MRTKYRNIVILGAVNYPVEITESGPSSVESHAESHGQRLAFVIV
jgi:hypothetical protein